MNKYLKEVYDNHVPDFNPNIINGFATTQVDHSLEYIDEIIKSSMKSATPLLQYHGYKRLTPEEEFKGLDIGEHGMESYTGFQIFTTQ